MKYWIIDNGSKKKSRGLRRRCRTFSKYIIEQTKTLPNIEPKGQSYLGFVNYQLCFDDFFISSKKTPSSVRKFFAQTIINQVQHLIDIKNETKRDYHILCGIFLPSLSVSNISIYYTRKGLESYYEGFSQRQGQLYPEPNGRNVEKEWGLRIPNGMEVKGVKVYKDDDGDEEYLWLIGELN